MRPKSEGSIPSTPAMNSGSAANHVEYSSVPRMKNLKKMSRTITIIRKSCLNGKAVWIYRGPSKAAARIAYYRVCRREIDRIKHWSERMARRRSNIARFLSACMAQLPINAELTDQQNDAARQLHSIEKTDPECHRDFYEHILDERRRKNFYKNSDYDKLAKKDKR